MPMMMIDDGDDDDILNIIYKVNRRGNYSLTTLILMVLENTDFYPLGHIRLSLLACIAALEESYPSGKKSISLAP